MGCVETRCFFAEVDKNYTSQICPNCNTHTGKKPLSERKHNCPECVYIAHRDVAAAQVTRNCGIENALGHGVSENVCGEGLVGEVCQFSFFLEFTQKFYFWIESKRPVFLYLLLDMIDKAQNITGFSITKIKNEISVTFSNLGFTNLITF